MILKYLLIWDGRFTGFLDVRLKGRDNCLACILVWTEIARKAKYRTNVLKCIITKRTKILLIKLRKEVDDTAMQNIFVVVKYSIVLVFSLLFYVNVHSMQIVLMSFIYAMYNTNICYYSYNNRLHIELFAVIFY